MRARRFLIVALGLAPRSAPTPAPTPTPTPALAPTPTRTPAPTPAPVPAPPPARHPAEAQQQAECAKLYTSRIAKAQPAYRPALAFQAAACPLTGKAIHKALRTLESFVRSYPTSVWAASATEEMAHLSSQIGRYAAAATLFEDYARREPNDTDALRALLSATHFRIALRDRNRVMANLRLFATRFNKTKWHRRVAAATHFAAASVLKNHPRLLVRHLRAYLRQHTRHGALPETLIVHATLGELLWKRSCRNAFDGLCVSVKPIAKPVPGKLPRRCGGKDARLYSLLPRNRKHATEATKHFRRAFALGRRLRRSSSSDDDAQMKLAQTWAARAQLRLIDADLERLIAVRPPLQKRQKQAQQILARYRALVKIDGLAGAPLERSATTLRVLAGAVRTLPIPRKLRIGAHARDKVNAFCAELAKQARPLEKQSASLYRACFKASQQALVFDAHAATCERELARVTPSFGLHEVIRPPSAWGKLGSSPLRTPKAIQAAIRRDPTSPANYLDRVWHRLKPIVQNGNGKIPIAAARAINADIERALALAPYAPRTLVLAGAFHTLVTTRPASAATGRLLIERELGVPPNPSLLVNAHGLLLARAGDLHQAAKAFAEAAKVDPKSAAAIANEGVTRLHLRDFKGAAARLSKAVSMGLSTHDTLLALGVANRGIGMLDVAEATYERAAKVSPTRGEAYFNMGLLFMIHRPRSVAGLGKAVSYFERALQRSLPPAVKRDARRRIAECRQLLRAMKQPNKRQPDR